MEDLKKYTSTEILKMINDTKAKHDEMKKEILSHVDEVENLENIINQKLEIVGKLESNYIKLIEELNERTVN